MLLCSVGIMCELGDEHEGIVVIILSLFLGTHNLWRVTVPPRRARVHQAVGMFSTNSKMWCLSGRTGHFYGHFQLHCIITVILIACLGCVFCWFFPPIFSSRRFLGRFFPHGHAGHMS